MMHQREADSVTIRFRRDNDGALAVLLYDVDTKQATVERYSPPLINKFYTSELAIDWLIGHGYKARGK